jgi:hypothetical protein
MLILSQGCGGGDSSTTPITPTPITGTYTLQSVNGQSLPWVIEAGVEITAGSVTLNQDMTCSRSITATATDGGTSMTITTTGEGTYTHTNGAVTVTWAEDGSTDSGSIVSSQLTLTAEGDVLIFRK